MRNRKRNRRFPSRETRVIEAMYASVSSFPDVEQKKAGGPAQRSAGHSLRITTLLLSYLSLPVVALLVLPEPLTPCCMFVAAYSAHKVLNVGEKP